MFRPRFTLTSPIVQKLMRIEALRHELDGLPIRATLLRALRETALLASTHYSTQIEGNLLTLPEVETVIAGGKVRGRERDQGEVRNHYRAFSHMERLAEARSPLAERDIQTLHGLVMRSRAKPSRYRAQQNVIRDSGSRRIVYLPPEAKDVKPLMKALVAWINALLKSGELPVPIVAALAHCQFATIHPYLDGNGRVARLLATLILRRAGYGLRGIYSLDEHYAKNLGGYYRALSIGTHNYYDGRAEADMTPFIAYFVQGMEEAFRKIRVAARREASDLPDQSKLLRRLSPHQRRLLPLFQRQGTATAAEMAEHLGMSPRSLTALCKAWLAEGFLEIQNPSRKARAYRLAAALAEVL